MLNAWFQFDLTKDVVLQYGEEGLNAQAQAGPGGGPGGPGGPGGAQFHFQVCTERVQRVRGGEREREREGEGVGTGTRGQRAEENVTVCLSGL
jgi:hypothetical protein